MSTLYVNGEPLECEGGRLGEWLFKHFPKGDVIALDTEASGLHVDGDWSSDASDCAPPARVSAVSMAWREKGNELVTVAMAFDQGKIAGKPGRWSHELDAFEQHPEWPESQPYNFTEADWQALLDWLKGKRIKMHNTKYDCHIMNVGHRLYGQGVDLTGQVNWDTMGCQQVTEPLQRSSLKPTGERLWGESSRDEEKVVLDALKKLGVGLTKRYDLLDWADLGPYAGKDAELTLRLSEHQDDLIEEGRIPELDAGLVIDELRLSKLLFKMELRRVGLDAPGMRDEVKKMLDAIKVIEKELPFEASINAAKRYFFGPACEGGLALVPVKVSDVCQKCTFNRAKGKQRKNTKKELCHGDHSWTPSLDGEVVERLVSDGVEAAIQWQHLANMESALSKWYRAWPYKAVETPDGWRIMTNFRQGKVESDRKGMRDGGAISGRLSAERVQLQGVPKEYRIPSNVRGIKPKKDGTPGLLQAKQGYQLWEIDASNAEVRVAAWASQCKALAAVINSGVNIHDGNTVALFGDMLAASFPGGWSADLHAKEVNGKGEEVFQLAKHPEWEMYRDLSKIGVFSEIYGAGVRTMTAQFSKGLGKVVPERVAREFKAALNEAYPELKRTAKRAQAKADKGMGGCGYVRLVNGRRRVFGWAERTHKAFNAVIQGGVAEAMKMLMLLIEDKHPGILINQVHDSVWVEVPDLFADLIVEEIQEMGAKLFTELFSTEDLPINFKFDAKQLA